MPRTPCSITIDPAVPVTVSISTAGGVVATCYTTENGASTHSLPLAISTATVFWLPVRAVYVISALYSGQEIAGPAGGTLSIEAGAGNTTVGVGINLPAEASTLQPTLAHGSAFTQTYATADRTVPAITAAAVATTASTQTTPYGFSTQAQADALVTAVNALVADALQNRKIINAVIDDGQAGVLHG